MLLPPLDPDKTIFNGGTFLLAAADSSDTSSSEWSRLAGFLGLFVAEDVGLIRLSPPRSLILLVEPFPPLSSLSERLPRVPLLILVVAVPILEFPEANVVQVDDDVVDAPMKENKKF